MPTLEEYFDGTNQNSHRALRDLPHHIGLLRTVDEAYAKVLAHLGTTHEGTVLFAGMSHAAFLATVQLGTSGQLPPAYVVMRGCVEDAIYAFFLFHHPELKAVWSARNDSPAAKKKVRDEFTIGRMKKFLSEKHSAIATQFEVVYDATIDLGAHPNALGAYSHLIELESGDFEWQYINTSPVDRNFALRMAGSAGICALNIFQEMFPVHFVSTAAGELLTQAHDLLESLPTPEQDAGA
jgi:hypothetical protein